MSENYSEIINQVVDQFGKDRSRLLDIAREVQAQVGYLPEEAMALIPQALGIHLVEVRDMASFYAFFEQQPKGKVIIRFCDAVVERMKGADEVIKAFEEALGISIGETTSDGMFSLERTSCIGMSDQAPSALINGVPVTGLNPADVPEILKTLRQEEDPAKLPQARIDRNLRKPGAVIFAPFERGEAVRKAVNITPDQVIKEINAARLRGRGGAGFPTAMKWDFCRKTEGDIHYVICNADEGEPGTFKDRVVLTRRADLVFEGMTVAGYAIGSEEGILYLRGEYEYLLPHLDQVLAKRRNIGMLGENICGREGFNFDIRIQLGAGAYICGEESAMLESLEGKRGAPRDRPPFPVRQGYKNQPTAVNNVETLCCAARILEKGAAWFSKMGTKDSTGTKLLSVSGDCARPGVYEIEYGITMGKLLEMVEAPDAQAIQVGGPSGQCLAPKDFGRSISYEDLPTGGSLIVFGQERDLLECMTQFVDFFADESCGWCAPCRVGTTLLHMLMNKVLSGKGTRNDLDRMAKLGNTMKTLSRCGLGQTAPNPVLTTLQNFSGLYNDRIKPDANAPHFDLSKALQEGASITDRTHDEHRQLTPP